MNHISVKEIYPYFDINVYKDFNKKNLRIKMIYL